MKGKKHIMKGFLKFFHRKRNLNYLNWLFFLSLLFLESALGQKGLSVKEAVDYALEHQESIKRAWYDYQAAVCRVKEMISLGLPQISGAGQLLYYYEIPTTLLPAEVIGGPPGIYIPVKFGVPWNVTLRIDANQLLFDGTYFVGLQASRTYKELMKLNLERNKVETIAKVIKAYYTVLINEKQLSLLKNNLERIENLYIQTQKMVSEGFLEPLDLKRIEVQYSNLKTEVEKVTKMVELSYLLLKFQMGMPLDSNFILTDTLPEIPLELFSVETNHDVSQRYEIKLIEKQIQLKKLQLKQVRSQYYPKLYATGSIATQALRQEFNLFDTKERWFPIGVLGLSLQVPIFDSFNKHYKAQQALMEIKKAQSEYRETSMALTLEIEKAKTELENQLLELQNQERNLLLAQEIYETALRKYQEGVGSNLEVLNAESGLKDARDRYYNALLNTYLSYVDFKKAIGKLDTEWDISKN